MIYPSFDELPIILKFVIPGWKHRNIPESTQNSNHVVSNARIYTRVKKSWTNTQIWILDSAFICYRTNVRHEVLSGDQICRWLLNSDSQKRMSLLLELSYYVLKIFRHSILVVLDFDELVVGFKNLLVGTVTTKCHRAKRRLITTSSKVSWQCTNNDDVCTCLCSFLWQPKLLYLINFVIRGRTHYGNLNIEFISNLDRPAHPSNLCVTKH